MKIKEYEQFIADLCVYHWRKEALNDKKMYSWEEEDYCGYNEAMRASAESEGEAAEAEYLAMQAAEEDDACPPLPDFAPNDYRGDEEYAASGDDNSPLIIGDLQCAKECQAVWKRLLDCERLYYAATDFEARWHEIADEYNAAQERFIAASKAACAPEEWARKRNLAAYASAPVRRQAILEGRVHRLHSHARERLARAERAAATPPRKRQAPQMAAMFGDEPKKGRAYDR